MRATDIGNLCFEKPIYLSGKSAWAELIPVAFTLVEKLRPRIFVELGTHYGDSYCAFCQAIVKAEVDCQAYAVDTWAGDEHAGFYGEDVLNQLRARHDVPYSAFSSLLRETFDDAATHFAPGTVDLLHIDGLHTYDAVKNDFMTWLPLLSERAVVILHDINVRERGFGVWKLFDELSEQYPTFRFDHSHGLGIVAVGSEIPEGLKFLFSLDEVETLRIKEFYASLGLTATNERKLADALHIQNAAVEAAKRERELAAKDLEEREHRLDSQRALTQQLRSELDKVEHALKAKEKAAALLNEQNSRLAHQVAQKEAELHTVLNTRSWRLATRAQAQVRKARKLKNLARRVLIAKDRVGGWKNLYRRVKQAFNQGGLASLRAAAFNHLSETSPSYVPPEDIITQRLNVVFADIERRFTTTVETMTRADTTISLLMPVYKVPLRYLSLAIDSVLRQSYDKWQLCIADDCSGSAELTNLLSKYAEKDSRITFVTLEKNSGIAAATNRALELATGTYVALLDNDDILTSDALHWVADAIQENPKVDWLYSDECKVNEEGKVLEIFTKPDWSPSLLLNCMYTGHLSAYRKALVEQVGGFRSEYDFSQDYDLALRVSESTNEIRHIEKVLYGWRTLESSGAAGGKPYARDSNIRALQAAGDRRGWKGKATALPFANRFEFDLKDTSELVSIVIPSDNAKNISDSIESIQKKTSWSNYEILVVTNSLIVNQLEGEPSNRAVRFVRYDQPYSFSDKCNKGAEAASGEYIVFFNDDVRVQSIDWVESMVEFLQQPSVGIVGPKLVYESNTIQHAGMVTGVRRLLGTAFHCLPEDTGDHYNFAQSVREVSLICGACLGIRKDVFDEIGGFDEKNAPINHSDVDLCFKVRELGYSCVYTPHSTLTHIGHMSLATVDAKEKVSAPKKKDKADIFILKRFAPLLARDPYYTKAMREQLFRDSPQSFELFAPTNPGARTTNGKDILIFSHDLTESGAPRVVYEIAKMLVRLGNFVVVAAPSDGPIRKALQELGVPVIVDELLLTQHGSVFDFARNFDAIICNTVITYPVINQLSDTVDTFWYIHETQLFLDMVNSNPSFRSALSKPKKIWAGSKLSAGPIETYNPDVEVLEYGFPGLSSALPSVDPSSVSADKLMVRTFGSYEPRKGQDLLTLAIKGLPAETSSKCTFEFYGRTLDQSFYRDVMNMSQGIPNLSMLGDLGYADYVELVISSDLIVVPSRDDTLPLVSLHALSAGVPLMCTPTTGTSAYLKDSKSGYVFPSGEVADMTRTLEQAIRSADKWTEIGKAGSEVFNKFFSEEIFAEKLAAQLALK